MTTELKWLPEALEDFARLHDFLRDKNQDAARNAAAAILLGAELLAEHPRAGRPLPQDDMGRREWFVPFGVGAYVIRYRLEEDGIPVILRVWHTFEFRDP